jgi:hypothetical protein
MTTDFHWTTRHCIPEDKTVQNWKLTTFLKRNFLLMRVYWHRWESGSLHLWMYNPGRILRHGITVPVLCESALGYIMKIYDWKCGTSADSGIYATDFWKERLPHLLEQLQQSPTYRNPTGKEYESVWNYPFESWSSKDLGRRNWKAKTIRAHFLTEARCTCPQFLRKAIGKYCICQLSA